MDLVVPFSFVHHIAASPEAVLGAMLNPGLPSKLVSDHPMIEEADGQTDERSSVVRRRLFLRAKASIERIGHKKIPSDALSFVEDLEFDRETLQGHFETRSMKPRFSERIVQRGTTSLHRVASGTERRIEGTLEVRNIPFVLRPLAILARKLFESEAGRLLEFEAKCLQSLATSAT